MDSVVEHASVAYRLDEEVFEYGDLLVRHLERLRVDYVFGIPGGGIEPLYNALARSARRGGPRPITVRHEASAAFLADGYHARTGRLGVCCATTGPGATNLITGVASAFTNHIPMLAITAQTALPGFGHGAFQDSSCAGIDTVGMFKHITRYSTLVSHVGQLEQKLVTAIKTAFGSQPGPAHLSIPFDLLRAPARPEALSAIDLPHWHSRLYDHNDIEVLETALLEKSSPVFVLGAGAKRAMAQILTVAERVGATIVATPHAKGMVDPFHPLFGGILGYGGHRSAVETLRGPNCDLIICIGTLISERVNALLKTVDSRQALIHIDQRESNFFYTARACTQIKGCVGSLFEQLAHRLPAPKDALSLPLAFLDAREPAADSKTGLHFVLNDQRGRDREDGPLKPHRLMLKLPEIFPADTRYVVDSGCGMAWALHYLHAPHRGDDANWFYAAIEFTSMGWAIGASIGWALGGGDPVVCVTGDGSMLMGGQEITIAVQERLPIVFVVLNDTCLGMVKHGQRLTGAEPVGFEMPPTDFPALARSMGARAYTIKSLSELDELDGESLFKSRLPTLLDVHIDPEAVPPFANRIKTLME